MPDYSTLIPFAAPAVTLIGAIAALFGVWLTQKNNRETKLIELEHNRELKEMELEHNRKLKLLDIREQTARTIRGEKREAYLELLRAYRITVGYTVFMGEMSVGQDIAIKVNKIKEALERLQGLMSDLDLVASPKIRDLAQKLYVATARCQDVMYRENERLFNENANLLDRGRHSQEELSATAESIWKQVQAEVQKAFEEQGVHELFGQLRNQTREELGIMAIDPKLVPPPEELEELRREINTL